MKKLSTRLFIIFFVLMAVFTLCNVLLNELFLEDYFIFKNKKYLLSEKIQIEKFLNQKEDFSQYIVELDRDEGISTLVVDKDLQMLKSSNPMNPKDKSGIPAELEEIIKELKDNADQEYIYDAVTAMNSSKYIVLVTKISKDQYLMISKSMKELSYNASIANEFFMYIGILLLLIGSIVMKLYSKRLTQPVQEIRDIAMDIAELNFSRRVEVLSKDELGSLSESINIMADRLDDAIVRLNENLDKRKQLLRDITHELKTPIGVILGYVEALKYGVSSDSDEYYNIIISECNRMDRMVKELLNQSVLESGSVQLRQEEIDMKVLIKSIMERFHKELKGKRIGVTSQYAYQNNIVADQYLIDRVITNFIVNAIRHTSKNGKIEISFNELNEMFEIGVFNTGSFIPEEEIDRVWDAFYKVDKARKRNSAGQGIGLSIVKSIVELHDGICFVENLNNGVRFVIRLPKISH
ncbi:sensor histidine kinase [Vallitalea okinawensis]|uniref:sensor histidine kinase n=1 Tax=Vallitalea okinawensis TaxID=2078660 RepID=UPI000CFD75CE|nr:HAMP domain-containing sensor histidine kinase [Vallitalea okinawensis]